MPARDYSEDDDFYSQGFEKKGVASVWFGLENRGNDKNIDTLQDLCGVGYYRLSDQESNCFDYKLVNLERLLEPLSFSTSYLNEVISAARMKGIDAARRVVVQYDFSYDPSKVRRSIAADIVFIGVFKYFEI